MALLSTILVCATFVQAQSDWQDSYATGGSVTVTEDNNVLKATSALDSSSTFRTYLTLKSGNNLVFHPIEATVSGTGTFTNPDGSDAKDSMVKFYTANQPNTITNSADLTWTTSSLNTEPEGWSYVGNGVLYGSLNNITGGDFPSGDPNLGVILTHSGAITLNSTSDSAIQKLDLPILADLSGILAVSGNAPENNNAPGSANGTVELTTASGSTIDVKSNPKNADSKIVTAGIMAATSYLGFDYSNPYLMQIEHSGSITVEAPNGVGIFTSGMVPPVGYNDQGGVSGSAAEVAVTLEGSGSISTTGKTGIGILAFNQTYGHFTINPNSTETFHSGTVGIDLKSGSDALTTGGSDSLFSFGVLGVSSGSTMGVAPFGQSTGWQSQAGTVGGAVTINSDRAIETEGDLSVGIAALSAGVAVVTGVSGEAGEAVYLGNTDSNFSGGGGEITITTTANGKITTKGQNANGIYAGSVPTGGMVFNLVESAYSSGDSDGQGLILGDQTSGSNGSNGKAVTVTSGAPIMTGDGQCAGTAAIGIVAQSIGGGGGSYGGETAFLIGGAGGAGGSGGTVKVIQQPGAAITTMDDQAVGILGHSIGGGGGNGANAKGFFVAVGGAGGSGGAGGNLQADIQDAITTQGDYAGGAIFQSIGGGGGHGGSATAWGKFISLGIGGSGGTGGHGGAIIVGNRKDGKISSVGEDSAGILAHSIGGGGGTGGYATDYEAGSVLTLSLSVGGSGGTAGSGGSVVLFNEGTLSTGVAASNGNPNSGGNSTGMLAQSIGGGGGHGGSASSKSYDISAVPDIPNLDVTLAFGGSGGSGSDGGEILALNLNTIETHGDLSAGLVGHSVGGGGGSGGKADVVADLISAASDTLKIQTSLGGNGGDGGSGGFVAVDNGDLVAEGVSIKTTGNNSAGLIAQSIGGGGGYGGTGDVDSDAKEWSKEVNGKDKDPKTLDYSFALGGSGGSGGNGHTVESANSGDISTAGTGSAGMIIQSIGGGGGIGRGASADGGNTKNTINLDIGGSGGDGGSGDDVKATNNKSITTSGGDSVGILAQSIGGGGGDAGQASSSSNLDVLDQAEAFVESDNAWTANIAVGGSGGSSNGSGTVTVNNEGGASISTSGGRSFGIHAQSISGGGGRGGAASNVTDSAFAQPDTDKFKGQYTAELSLAGSGGASPTPGSVFVNNFGSIETSGFMATGIVAQSIGGGGGTAANGSTDTLNSIGLGLSLDGQIGSAGGGGDVFVENAHSIKTGGRQASGILAQSIGGGGGLATAGKFINSKKPQSKLDAFALKTEVTLGCDLPVPSDGGEVSISLEGPAPDNEASIHTAANWAFGVVGQSIGGGGGMVKVLSGTNSKAYNLVDDGRIGASGGSGNGTSVTANLQEHPTITTAGYGSAGILLQSIGGGGGIFTLGSRNYQGGSSDEFSSELGAFNPLPVDPSGGEGGSVSILGQSTGELTVETKGDFAHGIILQSISQGGGLLGTGTPDAPTNTDSPLKIGFGSRVGNFPAKAGSVKASSFTPSITTSGANAFGLVAQSIGGGGGIAMGSHMSPDIENLGGGNGDGGEVSLDLAADSSISTSGEGAHALVAQSIGGGGGILQPSVSGGKLTTNTTTFPFSATVGNGDAVTVNAAGKITTTGEGAVGILAQLLSGGGGLAGNVTGTTGSNDGDLTPNPSELKVTLTEGSSLSTSGKNTYGIFAQSAIQNLPEGNNIIISVSGSLTAQGTGSTGVFFSYGGVENALTIESTGSIEATTVVDHIGPKPHVVNHGKTSGSIRLGGDSGEHGVFDNYGSVYAGDTIEGVINNEGNFLVGPEFSGGVTTVIHDAFNQSAEGRLVFDILGADNHDSLQFREGAIGDVQGGIKVVFADGYRPTLGREFALLKNVQNLQNLQSLVNALTVVGLPGHYRLKLELRPDEQTLQLVVDSSEPGPGGIPASLANAQPLGEGYYATDWFGTFFKPNTDPTDSFIFSNALGWTWFWPIGSPSDAWWFSYSLESWMWGSEETERFYYHQEDANWYYVYALEDGGAWIYNTTTREWHFLPL